ncbi:MAG: hypothetical protein PHN75_14620, partial [Syntrophales bacterium]|nr:hypothetical protein [Syntrophales bacterium]
VYRSRVEEALKRYHLHTGGAKLTFKSLSVPAVPKELRHESLHEPKPVLSEDLFATEAPPDRLSFMDLSFIGQAAGTYLIFEGPEGLILVDQHAAHERILFEKLRGPSDETVVSQQLLLPDVITLSPQEFVILTDYMNLFQEMGLDIEPFGENTIIIKAIPAMLPDLDPPAMIRDIIDDAAGMEHSPHLQEKRDRLLAVLACRGAVKANHTLSPSEVTALCRELDKTAFAATCPHGRPTYIPISRKELERMFKRR